MTHNRSIPWDWETPHIEAIRTCWGQRYQADVSLRHVVREARRAGVTWQRIGEVLGVTRQAAQSRFGHDTLFTHR
jgi:hypothetical protein